jgi:hypothetical protein
MQISSPNAELMALIFNLTPDLSLVPSLMNPGLPLFHHDEYLA